MTNEETESLEKGVGGTEANANAKTDAIIDGENESDSISDRFSDITIIDQGVVVSDISSSSSSNNNIINNSNASMGVATAVATHIIVLIHGFMGNPAEMAYIRESIQNAVVAAEGNNTDTDIKVQQRFVIHSSTCNCQKTYDGIAVGGSRLAQEINQLVEHVVEKSDCGSSDNGISANNNSSSNNSNSNSKGRNQTSQQQKFTLSIVGNSLGGLYARHALAGIDWDIGRPESSAPPVMLIPMVFLTTATPHLGISQHTYVPLPRAAEFVVAQSMKETGRDFFRFTPVLEDLFCKDYFLDPLSSFQQRIAYINVYGTDFQVPTATAAFWAPDSDSPHYRVKYPSEESLHDAGLSASSSSSSSLSSALESSVDPSAPKAIVMTLTTPRRSEKPMEGEEKKGEEGDDTKQESDKNGKTDPADVFTSWSKRLDRLGWTKVLVDVREDVPGVRESIASAIDGSSSDGNRIKDEDDGNDIGSQSGDSVPNSEQDSKDDKTEEFEPSCEKTKSDTPDEKNDGGTEENTGVEKIPDWTRKDTWTAGELLAEFKGGLLMASKKTKFTKFNRLGSLWDLKPRLPLGHAVLIANAKDEFNKKVTSGGKPVMDYLGASLVRTLKESVPSRSNTDAGLHEC